MVWPGFSSLNYYGPPKVCLFVEDGGTPRRVRIGGAAAEGLPACASGEHKAEDGDPETSEHVLMYLCAVNLEQCAAAALKYSFAT